MSITPGFFRTLGIKPHLGRDFESTEMDSNLVLISFGAWQSRFGASQQIVGQSFMLSGTAHTIIGVLPREFQFAPSGNA